MDYHNDEIYKNLSIKTKEKYIRMFNKCIENGIKIDGTMSVDEMYQIIVGINPNINNSSVSNYFKAIQRNVKFYKDDVEKIKLSVQISNKIKEFNQQYMNAIRNGELINNQKNIYNEISSYYFKDNTILFYNSRTTTV